jgi:hypothetical protein
MLTMAPDCWRSMTGRTYLQARKAVFRFRSTCASHTSSLIETGSPAAEPPDVVHEYIDAAVAFDTRCHRRLDLGIYGHVAAMCDAFAAFFFDQRARGSRRLFVDIDREDLGALSSQQNRSRFSVPPAWPYRSCAAHDGDFFRQIQHKFLPRSFGAASLRLRAQRHAYAACAAMNNLHRSYSAAMPSYIGTAYRSTGNLRSFQSTIPPWRL